MTGLFCETDINECLSNPCQNGAHCTQGPTILDYYKCQCEPGFYGVLCENDLDECRSFPCNDLTNDAVCINGINEWSCECPAGFIGVRCNQDVNECLSLPCQFGICLDEIDQYICTCPKNFTGTNCDQVYDFCGIEKPCHNNAKCLNNPLLDFTCLCQKGWTGIDCSIEIDECEDQIGIKCDVEGTEVCLDEFNGFSRVGVVRDLFRVYLFLYFCFSMEKN